MSRGNAAYYQRMGEYYGYPSCCIKAFIKQNEENKGWADREPEVIQAIAPYNHGFVPCVRHAKLLIAGQITWEDIILKKRRCPEPFNPNFNQHELHN